MVGDGAHLFAGDVFAELEVMKMVMELRVAESGWYEQTQIIFLLRKWTPFCCDRYQKHEHRSFAQFRKMVVGHCVAETGINEQTQSKHNHRCHTLMTSTLTAYLTRTQPYYTKVKVLSTQNKQQVS